MSTLTTAAHVHQIDGESFGLDRSATATATDVGDPEPDDGPVRREQSGAPHVGDDVEHGGDVGEATRAAVQHDVS